MISTSTATENVAEMLSLIKAELARIANNPVSAEELSDAKAYLIGALPLSLTSTDKIAGLLLSLQLDSLPIHYLEQRQAAIEATTVTDVQALSAALLKPEALTTVLVGKDPIDIEETEKVGELPNVE